MNSKKVFEKLLVWIIGMLLIPITLANPCPEGLQFFADGCYKCDGMLYQRVNGNIVCIKCSEGFEYDFQGGCKPIITQERNTGAYLDNISSKISPENPLLGFLIIITILCFVFWRTYKKWLK